MSTRPVTEALTCAYLREHALLMNFRSVIAPVPKKRRTLGRGDSDLEAQRVPEIPSAPLETSSSIRVRRRWDRDSQPPGKFTQVGTSGSTQLFKPQYLSCDTVKLQ